MNTFENNFPIITPFEKQPTPIEGLYIVTMKQIEDERGTIREFFRLSTMQELDITGFGPWQQINATETRQGAIRGLHAEAMSKLVAVVEGEAFGAYVDLRPDSASRGTIFTTILKKGMQVIVPKGVANGFQSVSAGVTQYLYCFDTEWQKGMSGYSITPLDPALGFDWPIAVTKGSVELVSDKDANAPSLQEALDQSALAK